MYSSRPIQQVDLRRSSGRVFAVGDIHGQYDALMRLLERQGFSDADHLLLVGDLVDRGQGSLEAINFVLQADNVHSVLGNHEEMMAQAYRPLLQKAKDVEDLEIMAAACPELKRYLTRFGDWMYRLSQQDWAAFHAIMNRLDALPYVLDVTLPGDYRVGVCHAHYPEARFGAITETQIKADPRLTQRMTWDFTLSSMIERWAASFDLQGGVLVKGPRKLPGGFGDGRVAEVDLLLHGHMVMPSPILVGNRLFLDTGGCFPWGYLSLVELTMDGPRLVDTEAHPLRGR